MALLLGQSIEKSAMSQLLHQSSDQTTAFIASKGWKSDDTTVYFPLNDANQAKIASGENKKKRLRNCYVFNVPTL